MTFVFHAPRTQEDLLCDAVPKLRRDVMKATKKPLGFFRPKAAPRWFRIAIIPEGTRLPIRPGAAPAPIESELKLDRDGRVNESVIREAFELLAAEGILLHRIESFDNNPHLGIERPYYEVSFEVRGV